MNSSAKLLAGEKYLDKKLETFESTNQLIGGFYDMDSEINTTPHSSTSPLPLIRNVSDTAWLVAAMRVIESQRSDALFNDPMAVLLLGEVGQQMIQAIKNRPEDISWFLAVRTVLLDTMVSELVEKCNIDCIVNLACGLCTRPYRLKLPSSLRWIDVDFAPVIQHRRDRLANAIPSCQIESRALDLRIDSERKKLLSDVASEQKQILVITEGLLPYLSEENITHLSEEILSHPQYKYWISDVYGPNMWTGKEQQDIETMMKQANAQLQFLPENGAQFFTDKGWKLLQIQNFLSAAKSLHRMPEPKNKIQSEAELDRWKNCNILLLGR